MPFPSPMHESEKWKWSHSVVSDCSDPMDCSPPGFSIHGIFQAKVLEWGAIAFSKKAYKDTQIVQRHFFWRVVLRGLSCWFYTLCVFVCIKFFITRIYCSWMKINREAQERTRQWKEDPFLWVQILLSNPRWHCTMTLPLTALPFYLTAWH